MGKKKDKNKKPHYPFGPWRTRFAFLPTQLGHFEGPIVFLSTYEERWNGNSWAGDRQRRLAKGDKVFTVSFWPEN